MGKIDEIKRDAAKKAAYFENRTEAQELADHKWAEKNGLSFSGPGALTKAIAASKQRAAKKARKSKVDVQQKKRESPRSVQASTPASWRRSRQKPNAWAYPTRHYSIPLSSGTQKENLT